jgi:hypothetical protein
MKNDEKNGTKTMKMMKNRYKTMKTDEKEMEKQ